MSLSDLPGELIDIILTYLSNQRLHDLALASLVCREWQIRIFPHLYHTVHLSCRRHFEMFFKRVDSDNEASKLFIPTHLKALILVGEAHSKDDITECSLSLFTSVIPKLSRLRHLSWNLSFVPRDPEVIQLFQTHCQSLDSVQLSCNDVYIVENFYSDQYRKFFNFTNLSHISIFLAYWPHDFDIEHEPLIDLLTSCPNIVSFKFALRVRNGTSYTYSPCALLSSLGDHICSHIRTFHMQGCAEPDGWYDPFTPPIYASPPLLGFFTHHSGIEELSFGYVPFRTEPIIDPDDVPTLFPSLKRFEGPPYLFEPILASSLAAQLESLTLTTRIGSSAFKKICHQSFNLPKLQKVAFCSPDDENCGVIARVLDTIVKSANQLEEIELKTFESDFDKLMSVLWKAKNLRRLTLHEATLLFAVKGKGIQARRPNGLRHGYEYDSGSEGSSFELDSGWAKFVASLGRICPRLHLVQAYQDTSWMEDEMWVISRQGNDISVSGPELIAKARTVWK